MKAYLHKTFKPYEITPVKNRAAFTRADLLAVIVIIGLSGAWFAVSRTGEAGRIAQCTRNLKVLGEAMQEFAYDHGGLPPAGVDSPQITWDSQLAPYLESSSGKSKSSTEGHLSPAVASRFSCPSDPFLRGATHRSYAMSFNDMQPANWPPGPESMTGVGLWWDSDSEVSLLGHATTNLDELSLVKLSWMPDPANTLLLTEFLQSNNRIGHVDFVRVGNPSEQASGLSAGSPIIHHDRFNYLMADGHVELLTPLQTGGIGGTSGIWTIKKVD